MCFTESNSINVDHSIALLFRRVDEIGLREFHDDKIKKYLSMNSNKVTEIKEESTNVTALWTALKAKILDYISLKPTPIKVLIDSSTIPKYFLCAILGLLVKNKIAKEITIIYTEGKYPDGNGNGETMFTGALWNTVSIDALEGEYFGGRQKNYLVSVGFEGDKIMRSVLKADPDKVSILLPNPGFQSDYVKRTLRNNLRLREKYCISKQYMISAHAGDAIQAWKVLNTYAKNDLNSDNLHYLCCGTKPHAIGMALSAISLSSPCLLYNIPDEHKVVNIVSNGNYWKYIFRDITIL
jgi:hypothetical protein